MKKGAIDMDANQYTREDLSKLGIYDLREMTDQDITTTEITVTV